jgi:hypothetical protein
MSSVSDRSKLLSAMMQAADRLLSAGQMQDALVVLASESIIRAHFESHKAVPKEPLQNAVIGHIPQCGVGAVS